MPESIRPQHKAKEITSAANPLIKVFRHALAEGVTREGWIAIEGPYALEEALNAPPRVAVQSVIASTAACEKFKRLLNRLPREAEVAVVDEKLFARVSATSSPQGIAALVELRQPELAELLGQRNVLLLVACGVQDPGNLGTMMRSAQALGAAGLLTVKGTVSPFNPKAGRASAGAIFHLSIIHGLEAGHLIKRLKEARVGIVASEPKGSNPIHRSDLRRAVALFIGREGSGLPGEITRSADLLVSIPIRAGMDSVNAATAAGIFLYEAARQRGFENLDD